MWPGALTFCLFSVIPEFLYSIILFLNLLVQAYVPISSVILYTFHDRPNFNSSQICNSVKTVYAYNILADMRHSKEPLWQQRHYLKRNVMVDVTKIFFTF
jgi:hypothetical protein